MLFTSKPGARTLNRFRRALALTLFALALAAFSKFLWILYFGPFFLRLRAKPVTPQEYSSIVYSVGHVMFFVVATITTLIFGARIVITRRRFARRRRAGQCQYCGYTLYASSSSRCPECGSLK